MASKILSARTIQIHDVESNWLKAISFIPRCGEIVVYDIDDTHSLERFKIGDGKTPVNDLPFIIETNIREFFTSSNETIFIDSGRITQYEVNDSDATTSSQND